MKRCPVCDSEKPLDQFHKDRRSKLGVQSLCKTCSCARAAKWRGLNRARHLSNSRAWDKENRNPENDRSRARAWAKANPDKHAATSRLRHACKLRAVPPWADTSSIQLVYVKAREWSEILGIALHVDHIVPLKSEYVCGLHTVENMQLLSAVDNASKGNRTWPDMV